MKVARFPLAALHRVLTLALLGAFLLASPQKTLAGPTDNPADVLAAAKAWLTLIDAGQYEESYAAGSGVFHDSITIDKWVLALKTLRQPLGEVVSRKVTSHTFRPDGIPGLDAACTIITYDTSFAKADEQTESVVLKWENGKWLGLSYTWGPKPSDDAEAGSVPETMTTRSEGHITPSSPDAPPAPTSPPEQQQPLPQ